MNLPFNFNFEAPSFLERINKKVLIIGGIVLCALAGGGIWLKLHLDQKKAEELAAAQAAAMEFRAWSFEEVAANPGHYYIKDGDSYYPLVEGALFWTDKDGTQIPEAADGKTRGCGLVQNDQLIPTMYRDTELIYISADGEIGIEPGAFYLERFRDEGYSIGVLGLSNQNGNKFKYTAGQASYFPGSDASVKLSTKEGTEITIDKIDDFAITENNISSLGTIRNLRKGKEYNVDAYIGTNYQGKSIVADTHFLSSFELYKIDEYTLDRTNGIGFLSVPIPDYMWTGYYVINGQGLFRFVNGYESFGYENLSHDDYNTPYYVSLDANNNWVVNPAQPPQKPAIAGSDGLPQSESQQQTQAAMSQSGDPIDNIEDGIMRWHYDITINNQQKEMDITVKYSEPIAKGENGQLLKMSDGLTIPGADVPIIMVTSPSGEIYELTENGLVVPSQDRESSNNDLMGKSLVAKIENPETGTWNVDIMGMYSRVFDISATYLGSSMNMIVKDNNKPADMTVYIPSELKDGTFKFTWEDTNHGATFEIEGPDKIKFTNNRKTGKEEDLSYVSYETYGEVDFHVGNIPSGEYQVKILGESLGHLYFSYEDVQEENIIEENTPDDEVETTEDEIAEEEAVEGDTEDTAAEEGSKDEAAKETSAEKDNSDSGQK